MPLQGTVKVPLLFFSGADVASGVELEAHVVVGGAERVAWAADDANAFMRSAVVTGSEKLSIESFVA